MNTETKHTPGPWHRNVRAGGKYPAIFAGRNTHVAVANQMKSPEETEANIDLIAAAPDLLAELHESTLALNTMADHFELIGLPKISGPLRDRVAKNHEVIAKAEGRS